MVSDQLVAHRTTLTLTRVIDIPPDRSVRPEHTPDGAQDFDGVLDVHADARLGPIVAAPITAPDGRFAGVRPEPEEWRARHTGAHALGGPVRENLPALALVQHYPALVRAPAGVGHGEDFTHISAHSDTSAAHSWVTM